MSVPLDDWLNGLTVSQSYDNVEGDAIHEVEKERVKKLLRGRELIVFDMLDAGMSQTEIARELGVSRSRINTILKGIRKKYLASA